MIFIEDVLGKLCRRMIARRAFRQKSFPCGRPQPNLNIKQKIKMFSIQCSTINNKNMI